MGNRYLTLLKVPTVCFILIFSLPSIAAKADVYLSKGNANDQPTYQPTTSFDCRDKIYGIVTGEWNPGSEHLLEAYWKDPHGKRREHTRYKFIANPGKTRVWVWLRLHPAEPDILERLLMQQDDSLLEFKGEWKVAFFVDRQAVGKLTFQVACG